MSRGFESHRLRQEQHPAGCCSLFLPQTMQGLQGGIRTARARRFASRRGKMPRWGIFRARENSRVCAKSSTLRGAAFYFCSKLCKGCKVGFEQPVPGALRPAACAKYHYSISHWVVIFLLPLCKISMLFL